MPPKHGIHKQIEEAATLSHWKSVFFSLSSGRNFRRGH